MEEWVEILEGNKEELCQPPGPVTPSQWRVAIHSVEPNINILC